MPLLQRSNLLQRSIAIGENIQEIGLKNNNTYICTNLNVYLYLDLFLGKTLHSVGNGTRVKDDDSGLSRKDTL
jgi:hypothetical protein